MIALRDWSGSEDVNAMQQLASKLWPRGLWHPGGLGWSAAIDQLAAHLVVADDDDLVGWAGINQPGSLLLQSAPDQPVITGELLNWLLDNADGPTLRIDVASGDKVVQQLLVDRGFTPARQSTTFYRLDEIGLQATVHEMSGPLADGYSIRSVRLDEGPKRVAVHRQAWKPSDLPFSPDNRPVMDSGWTSSFYGEHYDRVRGTWLYDPDLDLVVVAPDGSYAGCCIAWYDPATGWTEIEPLGVVPEHRRRGLAGALCAEVAARTASAGGHDIFINTGPSIEYPAPNGAYRKAGFRDFGRCVTYSRHADPLGT